MGETVEMNLSRGIFEYGVEFVNGGGREIASNMTFAVDWALKTKYAWSFLVFFWRSVPAESCLCDLLSGSCFTVEVNLSRGVI